MKSIKRSLAIIVVFAVAFTFMFGSIASVYDDSDAYAASSLSKPKISLRTDGNKITVSWDKVSGAQKYQVAYKLSTAKKWTYKKTTKLKFTIKGKYNKKYKIKVRAIKGSKKSKWSRTATRKTGKQKAPTSKIYDLSKVSKLKNYSSFRIGKVYRLKDPMGTGVTRKVKISYGDILNISGEGVSVTIRGIATKRNYEYEAQITPKSVAYVYGMDPTGTLEQPDAQSILNGNTSTTGDTSNTVKNDSKADGTADTGTGTETGNTGDGNGTQIPGFTLPDLSNINIPGVDLSNIDWSNIQLPDLTVPDGQLPDVNIPGITDGTTPTIPGITDGTTPTIPGITDGTTTDPTTPATDGSTTDPTTPATDGTTTDPTTSAPTDISSVFVPQTITVVWTLDDTKPTRTQKDYINDKGDKVRGTVTRLQEILALRQLQANPTKPVWIRIYQGKNLVYESYNKTNK